MPIKWTAWTKWTSVDVHNVHLVHNVHYSYLNASIGCSAAAFLAG